MKTTEELQRLYSEQLLGSLKELEGRRKKTLLGMAALTAVAGLAGLVVMVPFIITVSSSESCVPCGLMFLLVLIFIGYVVGLGVLKGRYVRDFKGRVMPKIVAFIDEGLTYSGSQRVGESDFNRSRMFLKNPDRFTGEDYVSGVIGKTRIEFSEIHAEDKTEHRDSKGRRHTSYSTIFKGVFFIADFNKNFKGITLVLPDTAQKMLGGVLGSMLQSKNIMRPPLVKLEDPEFEKLFVVYGDDQVEARYILSTSLMQRITEFRGKTGREIYLSFVDNKVMVAVPSGRDMFEPRLFRSIVDYKQVEEYYNDLQLVTGIVEDLNLNTRIWDKQ